MDHQPRMTFGVANIDRQTLVNNVLLLAKAARIKKVPTILTTVETKSFSGNMWPQLLDLFPGQDTLATIAGSLGCRAKDLFEVE